MRKTLVTVFALGLMAVGLPVLPATAVEASLSGTVAPTWQTNNSVNAIAAVNGVVYVGGLFTSVRPPGAAAGTNETPRTYLAAFDAASGALRTSFNHVLDGPVWSIEASADGQRLFVGGDFQNVDGQARSRLAVFDTATDALSTTLVPRAGGRVKAMAVSGSTLYLGGSFLRVNGADRSYLAAISTTNASLLPWAPVADKEVYALAVAKDASHVYAGGNFDVVNGEPSRAVVSLEPTTGAVIPFPAKSAIPATTANCISYVKDLTVDDSKVYAAAVGDGGGCFDGTFAANISDGTLAWRNDCLGGTEAVEVVGGWLYKGSHAHDCSRSGGFTELRPSVGGQNLLVQSLADGSLGPWYPDTDNSGTTNVGPLAMATDGAQLFVGGDFRNVNKLPQQGFARFQATPNTRPGRPGPFTAASVEAGTVKLTAKAAVDIDDENLTYRLYRNNVVIATWDRVRSTFWLVPTLSYRDTGLTPGATYQYVLDVTDGTSVRTVQSEPVSITVAGARAPYRDQVRTEAPWLYWRLGETVGSLTAVDASGNGRNGTYSSGVLLGQSGALNGDTNTAALFNGFSGRVSADAQTVNPQQFTIETWFKTTTTRGGKLLGFGNSRTGTSSSYDRHLYMTNDGRIVFGVYNNGTHTVISAPGLNNGQWHHVAGVLEPAGMTLYVDGVAVGTAPNASAQGYNGYWRAGGDNLNGWPNRPSSGFFAGTLDEVAVHQYSLPAASIAEHVAAR